MSKSQFVRAAVMAIALPLLSACISATGLEGDAHELPDFPHADTAANVEGESPSLDTAAAEAARARDLLLQRRPAEALAHFDLALAQSPQDPRFLSGRGVALDQLGQHDEAQHSYRAARAAAPEGSATHANATINLALSLAISGDSAQALALLSDVARDGRYTIRARHNLAVVEAFAGRKNRAVALLRSELDHEMALTAAEAFALLRATKNPAAGLPLR